MRMPDWVKTTRLPRLRGRSRIPVYAPFLTGEEKRLVLECLDTTWLSSKGETVTRLEAEFAAYCGARHAVATSSGTASLLLSLAALGVRRGDEVIIPSFTMISTAFAVSYLGAVPVFADCEPETGNLDPEDVRKRLTAKTRGIIPVHVYGNPCRLDEISRIAADNRLYIIEDAAEALGSRYQGKQIGGTGNLSAFSMYINKIVTAGEGGMITTNSDVLYHKLKKINNYAFSGIRHFWHDRIGYNLRLSSLEAAVGLGQLRHIGETLAKKRQVYSWYRDRLAGAADRIRLLDEDPGNYSNRWMVACRILDKRYSIRELRDLLAGDGIETRAFFIPLHLQPVYRRPSYQGEYPHSEEFARSGVILPSSPLLTEVQVDRICSLVTEYLKK